MSNEVTLEQTTMAETLVNAMNMLSRLADEITHRIPEETESGSIREYVIFRQGKASLAAEEAGKAIFTFLLILRHTETHSALGRYALRMDENKARADEDRVR